ncbi:polysaccharide pyruvyl transferase family protein [Alteromonas sediminis]|uniref:Polysaccharide pyruvyl transferase family protein n=1 Tax=Alteromonas sediminis TaxID=2259342 RepID=A0A3N5Y729_9ALTE|nr:polysaccharide pyruvyl transferase family protein [Alteromonas sediminis]RPJ66449.1 polysaccharide pyruvyl transferase family protein [Alteromonas sediminis]
MARLLGLGSGHNRVIENYHDLRVSASQNTGNLVFNFALEQLIHLKETGLRWNTAAEHLNAYGDPVVVPMANNIGKHMDLEVSGPQLNALTVPFVVFGLGGQFSVNGVVEESIGVIPEGTIRWLKKIGSATSQPNISVRGEYTYHIFEQLGLAKSAIKLGCPSHFISSDKCLGAHIAGRVKELSLNNLSSGIGITAGNPEIKHLARLEQFLINLIDQNGGCYVVQNPKALICVAEGWLNELTEQETEEVRSVFFPDRQTVEMTNWMRQYARTYISVPQWCRDISKQALVVGTRIHGCQVALQAGVPTVCLYIDSRTKELCDILHIPSIKAQTFQKDPSIDRIIDTLHAWNWDDYDEKRMALCRKTLAFVEANGLKPTRHFYELAR